MREVTCLLLLLIVMSGCSSALFNYSIPIDKNDGLEVSSLNAEHIDSLKISELINKILNDDYKGITALLIARNNKVVLEEYFNGFDGAAPHPLYSAGKSIASIIMGLAVDRNLVKPTDKLLKIFEDYAPVINNDSPQKRKIELRHLLTMSSGIECGTFGDPKTDLSFKMKNSFKPYKTYLDQPMEAEPGKRFKYNDASPEIINTATQIAVKKNFVRFQLDNFYDPLGIPGENLRAGLTTRDFLKIGLLIAHKGMWKGKRILSKEWIGESTSFKIKPRSSDWFAYGYGYYWWLNRFNYKGRKIECVMAAGNGHQALYIFPEIDLVVAMNGKNFNQSVTWAQPHEIVQKYILDGLK